MAQQQQRQQQQQQQQHNIKMSEENLHQVLLKKTENAPWKRSPIPWKKLRSEMPEKYRNPPRETPPVLKRKHYNPVYSCCYHGAGNPPALTPAEMARVTEIERYFSGADLIGSGGSTNISTKTNTGSNSGGRGFDLAGLRTSTLQ